MNTHLTVGFGALVELVVRIHALVLRNCKSALSIIYWPLSTLHVKYTGVNFFDNNQKLASIIILTISAKLGFHILRKVVQFPRLCKQNLCENLRELVHNKYPTSECYIELKNNF